MSGGFSKVIPMDFSRITAESYQKQLNDRELQVTVLSPVTTHQGSVATLQVVRDRLAGCSFWPLQVAVYSSGGNLNRK
jgi:hypothetical protein